MTQTVAGEFSHFCNDLNTFKSFVAEQKVFKSELLKEEFALVLNKIRYEMDKYTIPDFKIKFLEWVLNDLLDHIENQDFSSNVLIKKPIKIYLRSEFKNYFEHELVRYPFVFQDIKQINWKWKYREILVVLFTLRHLGAFHESTADQDISNLKDMIFKSAPSLWESSDVEGSFKDISRLWNRIMEVPNKAMGKTRNDETVIIREKAAKKHLMWFSNELAKLLKIE
jgi:hypothetical protein